MSPKSKGSKTPDKLRRLMEYNQEKLHTMNLEQLLKLAKKNHKQGIALESRQVYSYILSKFPKNKKAKNGIKLLNEERSSQSVVVQDPPRADLAELLTLFNKAEFYQVLEKANLLLVMFPNSAFLNNICGASNTKLQKYESAIKNYKVAISITPNDPDLLYNLGIALRANGKLIDALIYFKKTIKIRPDYQEAFANIAGVMTDQGDLDMALQYYQRALEIEPNNHKILFNMGNSLRDKGRLDAAKEHYSKAITISPRFLDAHINLASIFSLQDDLSSAADSYELAIKIDPQSTVCYLSLSGILAKQGLNDQALGLLDHALALDPLSAEAHFLKALILHDQGDLLNALSTVEKALEIQPRHAEFNYNKAVFLSELGEAEAAGKSYAMAVKIEPDHTSANHNLGINLLERSKFKEGFRQYNWRFKRALVNTLYLQTDKPEWRGEKNKTVFVWAEQGIGDEILFAAMLPELSKACAGLIVQCDARLIPLYQRSFPKNIEYCSDRNEASKRRYDFHIPIGSLGNFFRQNVGDFNLSSGGYLLHDTVKASYLRQSMLTENTQKLVGISWKTSSLLKNANKRNVPLIELVSALSLPKVRFVCLQYGDVSDDLMEVRRKLGIEIISLSEINNRNDIDGLASLIMACDCVVSSVNVTLPLAGALGANTKALVPSRSEWYWDMLPNKSLFFKSLELFKKQNNLSSWNKPLESLRRDLGKCLQST